MKTQSEFELEHSGKFVILNLGISVPTGFRNLMDEDYPEEIRAKLPSLKVTKRGRKAVIPPKEMKPFLSLKGSARREALHIGMKFLDGMLLVPASRIDELEETLTRLQGEWEDLKRSFVARYDEMVQQWAEENPDMYHQILSGKIPIERVDNGLVFQPYRLNIAPVGERDAEVLNTRTRSLVEELVSEINDEASDLLFKCFYTETGEQKETLRRSSSIRIKKILDKVEGLSFLDPRFDAVVDLLRSLVSGYIGQPNEIVGDHYWKVLVGLQILSSESMLNKLSGNQVNLSAEVSEYLERSKRMSAGRAVQSDWTESEWTEVTDDNEAGVYGEDFDAEDDPYLAEPDPYLAEPEAADAVIVDAMKDVGQQLSLIDTDENFYF